MQKRILCVLMTTFFFLSFASLFAGNENILKIHDVEANAGETITIELEILNDDNVIGFNCDIPLPEGFSVVPGSGEHFRTTDHQLALSVIDENTARFMLFSMSNSFLEGNEGVVTTFEVETPDTPGTYTLDIVGTPVIGTIINGSPTNVLTGTESGDVTLTGGEFTLTINVVGEGSVNVDDTPYTEPVIIEEGSQVSLNAIAEDGWHFDEWTGDYAGNLDDATAAESTLTMPADDVELTATFLLTEFTVSFMVRDEEEIPLQGALVTINGEDLFTNENGEAEFQLFSGSYDYTVELECLLTADGSISVSDDLEVTVIMEGLPGDANGDGFVNVLDVLAIANYYATGDADPFCFENADINNDEIINVVDLLLTSNMFANKNNMMHHDQHSEDAHLYLNPGSISLTSDGTLAGLQFELKGSNLASLIPNLKLSDYQIVYGYDEEVFRAIIFTLNNEPIPQGNIEIVTFDDPAENLSWHGALAGNLIAGEVPVHTHTGEVTDIEDITNTIDYAVFPNPAENVFRVSINNQSNSTVSLSLVNIQGQTIQSRSTDEKGYSEVEFTVHDLPAGMYIINIQYKDQTVMDKIMLK